MDLGPTIRIRLLPFVMSHGVAFLCGVLLVFHWQVGLLILVALALAGMIQAWRNR